MEDSGKSHDTSKFGLIIKLSESCISVCDFVRIHFLDWNYHKPF